MPNNVLNKPSRICIAVEGLCCVGKTSIAHRLAALLNEAVVVPELLDVPPPGPLDAGYRTFYYRNDMRKSARIDQAYARGENAILDRYYVSTMAHYVSLLQASGGPLEISVALADLHRDHYREARHATHWVFVRSDPREAWERYRRLRTPDGDSQWVSREGTRWIADAMEVCFKSDTICPGHKLCVDSHADSHQVAERIRQWVIA